MRKQTKPYLYAAGRYRRVKISETSGRCLNLFFYSFRRCFAVCRRFRRSGRSCGDGKRLPDCFSALRFRENCPCISAKTCVFAGLHYLSAICMCHGLRLLRSLRSVPLGFPHCAEKRFATPGARLTLISAAAAKVLIRCLICGYAVLPL